MLNRRIFGYLVCLVLLQNTVQAQSPLVSGSARQIQENLRSSLLGQWVGVLEYRDYSEPDTSTKRVRLPVWLTITSVSGRPGGLSQHFVYDDGPGKVVTEDLTLNIDVSGGEWRITNEKGRVETYKVTGYEALHNGHGGLTITGPTIDNGRPAETAITLTIGRNLLTWTESNRAVATQPYVFRHSYTFTRSEPPAPQSAQPR